MFIFRTIFGMYIYKYMYLPIPIQTWLSLFVSLLLLAFLFYFTFWLKYNILLSMSKKKVYCNRLRGERKLRIDARKEAVKIVEKKTEITYIKNLRSKYIMVFGSISKLVP